MLADGTLCVACRPSPGLAVLKDGGKSWSLSLRESIILTTRAAPAGGGIFAFDSTGKLHRSSDGGGTFTVVQESPHQWEPGLRFAGGLAVSEGGKVMLWALGELVVSTDSGKTWKRHRIEAHWDRGRYPGMNRYASPEGKCSALAVTADRKTWLKCDSSLLCRSTDDGVSWTGSTTGLQVLCYFNGPAISHRPWLHSWRHPRQRHLSHVWQHGAEREALRLRFWQTACARPVFRHALVCCPALPWLSSHCGLHHAWRGHDADPDQR